MMMTEQGRRKSSEYSPTIRNCQRHANNWAVSVQQQNITLMLDCFAALVSLSDVSYCNCKYFNRRLSGDILLGE